MKAKQAVKGILSLLIAMMLLVAFNPAVLAHTEADPFVTDLIAAQYIDAGDVSVWNTGDYLYVRYETAGDWSLDETHLHVAEALNDIPQNNGNPPPGQFEYGLDHGSGTTGHTYAIDLDEWDVGDELYIAAHAVVCTPSTEWFFVQGIVAVMPIYAWPSGENVGNAIIAVDGDNLVVTYEATGGWSMLDTRLYLGTMPPTDPHDWLGFPYGHPGLGEVTTDAYTVPLADLGVECEETLYISTYARMIYHYDEWLWIERDCFGEETLADGWTKYFDVTIQCEYMPPECETAWAFGPEFPGSNWAMYFTYTVQ